jgi:AbrB family looped-hinge helix DNA binding protein
MGPPRQRGSIWEASSIDVNDEASHYRGNVKAMALSRSKVTSQGQISVPVEVRRKLGVGPGSILEWEEEGDKVIVRRSGRFSSEDIHRALFPRQAPKSRTLNDMKEGIRRRVRERYARH